MLVKTTRFELIAKGCPAEHHINDDRKENRNEDGNGNGLQLSKIFAHAPAGDHRLRRRLAQAERLGRRNVVHRALALAVHDVVHQIQPDPVEHDRRDDLIDIQIRFKQAGNRAPECAQHHSRQQAEIPRQLPDNCAIQRTKGAQGVLSGRTDVEQARLKRKSHRETGHDQRSGVGQHRAHIARALESAGDDYHQTIVPRMLHIDDRQRNQPQRQTQDDAN